MSSNEYSIQSKNNIKFGKLQRKVYIGISEENFKLRYANQNKTKNRSCIINTRN